MQVTENNSMAFLDWKVASVPVQRCNQVNRAASNGDWYGDRKQTQKDQTQEVTLDPRTLQNQLKRAEAASKLGHVKHLSTRPQHLHEGTVFASQCPPPSSSLLQIPFWSLNQGFSGIFGLIPSWQTIYFLLLGLNFYLIFLVLSTHREHLSSGWDKSETTTCKWPISKTGLFVSPQASVLISVCYLNSLYRKHLFRDKYLF